MWIYKILNWVIPLLYLAIMTMSIKANFKFIISDIHIYETLEYPIMYILIFINFSSFILCIFSDPGIVSENSYDTMKNLFKYDNIIFFDGNKCKTCNIIKLPRSKHCSICGHCIMLHDHHCIWMNNCVGYYNFKWFLIFLVSLTGILTYGVILNFRYLISHRWIDLTILLAKLNFLSIEFWKSYIGKFSIKSMFQNYLLIYYNFYKLIGVSLFAISDLTNTASISKIPTTNDAFYVDLPLKLAICFILICLIFIVVMAMFISEISFDMVVSGMTSNEKSKWLLVQDFITNKELYKYYSGKFPSISLNEDYEDSTGLLRNRPFVYIAEHYFYNDKILDNEDVTQADEFDLQKSCLDVLRRKTCCNETKSVRFDEDYIIDLNKLHGAGKYKYFTLNAYKETQVQFVEDDMKLVESVQEINNIYDMKSKWANLKLIFNGV